MKLIINLLFILVISFSFIPGLLSSNEVSVFKGYEVPKIRAFFLGNKDYEGQDLDLRYTVNDIQVFRQILIHVLKVPKDRMHYYEDLTLDQFKEKMNDFSSKIQPDEVVFFMYTGHGYSNGMPIFTDKKVIAPEEYFKLINGFNNNTIIVMDSCYSGAEGSESDMLSGHDEAVAAVGGSGGKTIKNLKGYRSNVLRIYSSLAHQQSREAQYGKSDYCLKPELLGKTYEFLNKIGYSGKGNGIFSICFASFFAETDFSAGGDFTFASVNSHINRKVSQLNRAKPPIPSQRPKMLPWKDPFKGKKSNSQGDYHLLYKEGGRVLTDVEVELLRNYSLALRDYQEENYPGSIDSYFKTIELLKANKGQLNHPQVKEIKLSSLEASISDAFYKIAESYGLNAPNKAQENLVKSLQYNSNNIYANNLMGEINQYWGEHNEAVKYYERVISLASESNETGDNNIIIAKANNNLGDINSLENNEDDAVKFYNQVLEISRDSRNPYPIGEASAHNKLGRYYYSRGDYKKAKDHFSQAQKINKNIGNKIGEATALNNLALINLYQDRNQDEALKNFNSAKQVLEQSSSNDEELAMCYSNMAIVYTEKRDFNNAITYQQKSVDIFQRQNNSISTARAFRELAMLYYYKKDYSNALNANTKSESIISQAGNKRELVNIYIERGIIYNGMKQYQESVNYLEKAKGLSEASKYEEGKARSLVNLMEVYQNIGKDLIQKKEYQKSIDYSNKSIKIYKLVGDEISMGRVYANIGYAYYNLKEFDRAMENLENALSLGKKNNDRQGVKATSLFMSKVYYGQGVKQAKAKSYDDAVRNFKRSYELRLSMNRTKSAAGTAESLASTYALMNDTEEAARYFDIAANLYIKARSTTRVARLYYNTGRLYYESGNYKQSINSFKSAIISYEKFQGENLNPQEAKQFLGYAYLGLANKERKNNNLKTAIAIYSDAIKVLEKNESSGDALAEAYEGIAFSYFKLNDFPRAVDFQEKLVKLLRSKNSPNLEVQENNLQAMKAKRDNR